MDQKGKFKFIFEEQYQAFTKENAWSRVFQLLNKSSFEKYCSNNTSVAKMNKNSNLNRYTDVVPYDESRVKLKSLENDYINASLVKVDKAGRSYILTQGPLPNTVAHFWLMIWEQNSRAIIMLNKLVENGIDKCYLYWPTKTEKNLKLDQVNLEVELICEKEDDKHCDFIIREFKLTHLKEGTHRTIYQYHTYFWPDFGTPKSPESFVNFLYTCRQSGYLNSNKYGPAVVHCSAGIGRSGTFCVVDSYLILLKKAIKEKKPAPDILELLLEMREYRLGLVQTNQQLKFVYEAIMSAMNSEIFKQEESEIHSTCFYGLEENAKEEQSSNESELRRRAREEKKQTTMNHIKRIKDKQKEIENSNQWNKLFKYGSFTLAVITSIIGILYYKYRSIAL